MESYSTMVVHVSACLLIISVAYSYSYHILLPVVGYALVWGCTALSVTCVYSHRSDQRTKVGYI